MAKWSMQFFFLFFFTLKPETDFDNFFLFFPIVGLKQPDFREKVFFSGQGGLSSLQP